MWFTFRILHAKQSLLTNVSFFDSNKGIRSERWNLFLEKPSTGKRPASNPIENSSEDDSIFDAVVFNPPKRTQIFSTTNDGTTGTNTSFKSLSNNLFTSRWFMLPMSETSTLKDLIRCNSRVSFESSLLQFILNENTCFFLFDQVIRITPWFFPSLPLSLSCNLF